MAVSRTRDSSQSGKHQAMLSIARSRRPRLAGRSANHRAKSVKARMVRSTPATFTPAIIARTPAYTGAWKAGWSLPFLRFFFADAAVMWRASPARVPEIPSLTVGVAARLIIGPARIVSVPPPPIAQFLVPSA